MSLGGLHAFFLKISTPPFIALITVATALLLWLIQFHGGVSCVSRLFFFSLPGVVRVTYSLT